MAILSDIRSTNWQISISGSGYVVEGIEDVRQCLDVLLRTQKGTDPLRPEFGSDIYQYIDKPVNVVIPNVKRAIISAIEMFEKRVEVVSIKHHLDVSTINFFITYRLIDSDLIEQLQLYISGTGFITTPVIVGGLIIEADIPENGAYQLMVNFIVNGSPAMPIPPSFGFANTSVMYAWIVANWSIYGTWYLLPGKIVGYLNNTVSTASMNISLSLLYRYDSPIVRLQPGQSYGINFQEDAAIPGTVQTVSPVLLDLLNYAIANYGFAGSWVIESYTGSGDFDYVDFNEVDFNTGLFYSLVLYTTIFSNAALEVSVV